jgi:hypothetical protein
MALTIRAGGGAGADIVIHKSHYINEMWERRRKPFVKYLRFRKTTKDKGYCVDKGPCKTAGAMPHWRCAVGLSRRLT